jgi:hypothetical protein
VSHPDTTVPAEIVPPDLGTAQEVSPLTFSQVRSALIKALRTSPEAREPLCDALELLEGMQRKLEEYRQALPPAAPAGRPGGKRRGKIQEYEIHGAGDAQSLTERRPGHSQPFRCPRATYDAAAEVLAAADGALHFDQLMERLNARTKDRQPDYRLRVALRFWMTHNAVARSRTKYQAIDRATFVETARRLWRDLEADRG